MPQNPARAYRCGYILLFLIFVFLAYSTFNLNLTPFNTLPRDSPAGLLLRKLQFTVQAAGGVPGRRLSIQQRLVWDAQYPCIARRKLSSFYGSHGNLWKIFASERWPDDPVTTDTTPLGQILEEYENLHRTCIQTVGDLNDHFSSTGNYSGHACKFTVVEFGSIHGIGNRILWLISAFAYSILTQRVLLIDPLRTPAKLFCEPFSGSSWKLPSDFDLPSRSRNSWTESDRFFKVMDSTSLPSRQKSFKAVEGNEGWNPSPRFLCDTQQKYLASVPWISFSNGCLYFLPSLFAVHSFRPVLEQLFPEKTPLTPLLRYLTVPRDSIWNKLQGALELSQFDTAVGMQIRYKDGGSMYDRLNTQVNSNILQCGLKHGFLPNMSGVNVDSPKKPSVGIFIASLYSGTENFLARNYNYTTAVKVVQLSRDMYQRFDFESNEQAMAEIMALSFCDTIVTTPLSTFGYLAQGYAGQRPWLVNMKQERGKFCMLGQSIDACYQSPIDGVACENAESKKSLIQMLPYLKHCQDDLAGLQLVPF